MQPIGKAMLRGGARIGMWLLRRDGPAVGVPLLRVRHRVAQVHERRSLPLEKRQLTRWVAGRTAMLIQFAQENVAD